MERDYYDSTAKKVQDFCWGFFGEILGWTLIMWILSFIQRLWRSGVGMTIISLLLLLASIGLAVYLMKQERRYIGIGMIAIFGIIPLAFGACFLIVISSGIFH